MNVETLIVNAKIVGNYEKIEGKPDKRVPEWIGSLIKQVTDELKEKGSDKACQTIETNSNLVIVEAVRTKQNNMCTVFVIVTANYQSNWYSGIEI